MAEASMINVFNSKIASFNKAVNEDDTYEIISLGKELLKIAFQECLKPTVNQTIKETYAKQSMTIISHLTNLASKPAISAKGGNDDGNNDPYYTTKQWFSDEVPNLNFSNIIGVQEVKDAFMVDVVAPLRKEFKGIYHKFRGDEMGSQILLWGPPGTGKTHIVKCLAGALNCKIAVVQTSEVLASVVGVAEKNIRDVFEQASKLDRCIIFLDEIDSICSDRTLDDSRNTKSILTTLLTCMDGFAKTKSKDQLRIIVAATNLPWKLDSALKRGGRFETQIYVPLPDRDARTKFIEMELAKFPHSSDIDVNKLVNLLDGYSGADIKAIMRQVANKALKRAVLSIINGDSKSADEEMAHYSDCIEVIDNYINSVTPEMLLRFEAYEKGISYAELLRKKGNI
ncbi:MAG: ATP-binding protein [Acholeplasmatales bacterium]|nr:ATP-binding protein [Acholeplasmatales bacterium]